MTVAEAAERLEVSPTIVRRLCASYARTGKGIAHHRIGEGRGSIRITEDDLAAFLDGSRVTPGAPPNPKERGKRRPGRPAAERWPKLGHLP